MNPIRKEVTIGDTRLILGDCLEVLPTLGRVDAVVTDPPYGVLDEAWDDMDERQLTRFSMAWLSQAQPLADTMVVFFGERRRGVFSSLLTMLYPEVRQLIWNKNGGQAASDRFFYAYESIYLCHQGEEFDVEESVEPKNLAVASLISEARKSIGLSKGGVDILVRGKKTGLCYRWEEACCLPTPEQIAILKKHLPLDARFDAALAEACDDRNRVISLARQNTAKMAAKHAAKSTDVITCSPPSNKMHPCEKPVSLVVRLLEAVPDASLILDPFMGSASTGLAAIKAGRRFIGIEREPKYFDIACERIRKAYAQPDMFVEAARVPEPVQEAMNV